MNENIPNCFKNRFSSKAVTIHAVNEVLKAASGGNRLLLLTSYGFISGDLEKVTTLNDFTETVKSSKEKSFPIDLSLAIDLRNTMLVNEEKESKEAINITDNGAVLNLTNVSISTTDLINPIVKINTMLVFVDQIIAVSAIPKDHNS